MSHEEKERLQRSLNDLTRTILNDDHGIPVYGYLVLSGIYTSFGLTFPNPERVDATDGRVYFKET